MNIQDLIATTRKPEIYAKGTAVMWVDEYISTRLLETHLSQDTDLASRKETTISSTIDWILDKAPGDNLDILDLGCGPGLYTEKLAEMGHRVTGMDFSANSIRYAKASAAGKELNISYVKQNYLELAEENKYDLVMMIFTDFGVLPPAEREILLANIHRALKPGGKFLFDVLNDNYPVGESVPKEWEAAKKGFWKNSPYLSLSESFYYEERKVALNQHIIIDETGGMDVYRFWIHTFSHADLDEILALHDFSGTACHDNVLPGCGMYRSKDVTFCITEK
ncbi:MAG: class I SAM-dependent methyltransferase [Desulfobacteraceae bacterium]|nr:class I SAM-dependent methyltransferase [Desulfobacteraceae bacterium]